MKDSDKNTRHKRQLGLSHPEDYFRTMRLELQDKLRQSTDEDLHEEQLGLTVPTRYFETSKGLILAAVKKEKKSFGKRLLEPKWLLGMAASIAIILMIAIGISRYSIRQNFQNELANSLLNEANVSEMLLSSLFVEDRKFNAIIDDYLLEYMVMESAVPIIETYDTTLESLFLEEQEEDAYLNALTLDAFESDESAIFE